MSENNPSSDYPGSVDSFTEKVDHVDDVMARHINKLQNAVVAVQEEVNSSGSSVVEDDAYGAGWDGDTTHAPSQNAVYDKVNAHESASDAHHSESHTVASHSDTSATGSELNTLTDGSDASTLHIHDGRYYTEDEVDSELSTLSGTLSDEIDSDISTHAGVSDAHHAKYTDAEARAAVVEDDAYGAGWDGDTTHAPSQNAVYDALQGHLDDTDNPHTVKLPAILVAANDSTDRIKNIADYTCDGSADQDTIKDAITAAGTGHKVVLAEGTYTINNIINNIPSDFVLQGMGWNTVIKIADGVAGDANIFDISSVSRVTVSNLKIDGNYTNWSSGGQNGIHFTSCDEIWVHDIYVHDLSQYGIVAESCTNVNIYNNRAYDTQKSVIVSTDSSYVNIHGNIGDKVENATGRLVLVHADTATAEYINIENNIAYNCGDEGIFCWAQNNPVRYVNVVGNLVYDCGDEGIGISALGGATEITDVIVSNNICVGNTQQGIYVEAHAKRVVVSNNICRLNDDAGIRVGRSCSAITLNNNDCESNSQGADDFYSNIFLRGYSGDEISDEKLVNNRCKKGSEANQPKYGIEINQYCSDVTLITNDITDGGKTGDLSDSGTNTTNITTTDLETLTDTSNADSLHEHAHDQLTGISSDDHHNRLHDIDSTSDHNGVTGATEDNFIAFDADGLPKDSGKADSDYADATHASEHESGGGDTVDHNNLTGLQGGTAGEYYHLTSAQHTNVPKREVQMVPFHWTADVETGDGKFYLHIGEVMDGKDLIYCHAEVITSGTTGTTDIQLHNVTDGVDMLSTKLTIDSGETGSDTAGTSYVIDTDNDDVAENDLIRVDIDAVQTTPPQGLIVTLGFA